jgi:hypothetical protein
VARTIVYLRQEIDRYIRQAGGLEMPDLREKAEACQLRIEGLGFRWDLSRLLWRAPAPKPQKGR